MTQTTRRGLGGNHGGADVNIWLRDFRLNIMIVGFRDVQIRKPDEFFREAKKRIGKTCVQFFDASFVAGSDHLLFAALNALNAFKSKENISSNLAIETLLYASAHRQIEEALSLIGVKHDTGHVVVLIMSPSAEQASSVLKIVSKLTKGKRDDSVVDLVDTKVKKLLQMFSISEVELEAKTEQKDDQKQAIIDLIIEHMALLVAQR